MLSDVIILLPVPPDVIKRESPYSSFVSTTLDELDIYIDMLCTGLASSISVNTMNLARKSLATLASALNESI